MSTIECARPNGPIDGYAFLILSAVVDHGPCRIAPIGEAVGLPPARRSGLAVSVEMRRLRARGLVCTELDGDEHGAFLVYSASAAGSAVCDALRAWAAPPAGAR